MKKFGGYKTEGNNKAEERERLALLNLAIEEKHLRDIRGIEGRYWNENVFARPNGLREKLKLRFRVGDLDLPKRRMICAQQ